MKARCPKTPRVGLEPTSGNCKPTVNEALTKNSPAVLDTCLDISLQEWPDLQQIITAWPELPEHIKAAIKALVQTHNEGKK